MLDKSKRTIATLTAAACLGAGGWAVAASSSGASTAATQTTQAPATTIQQQAPAQGQNGAPPAGRQGTPQGPPPMGPGGHGPGETLLTGDNAAKAKAAALAKVPGATVDRVETDANDGAAYEAHITKSDGSHATVLMDKSFTVTSVLSR